jgi:hypothetical protein
MVKRQQTKQAIWPEEWIRKAAYHDRWYKKIWRRINRRRYKMIIGIDPANGVDWGVTTIAFKNKKTGKVIIESVGITEREK